jgi:hypothetical protein
MLAGCATGGGDVDGSTPGFDGGNSTFDGGSDDMDAGREPPRDSGRITLPDAGPLLDSSFVTSCTGAANGTPCEADRNGCTEGDRCQDGACVPGSPVSCDDAMNCTTDRCVATGFTSYMCTNEASAMTCTIDGTCYANGMTNPASPCQRCNSSMSMSSWTVNAGSACDDGDSCTTGDMCMADGTCSGTGSGDMYEGNNTRASARALTNFGDCADWPEDALRITPSLYPAGDEDWFSFRDSDDSCLLYPRVDLTGIPSGQDYDLCLYYECAGLDLTCASGSASSMGGLQGCCSTASGNANESVRLDPDCDTTDDSGTIYIRVYRFGSAAPVCGTYTLTYGDD